MKRDNTGNLGTGTAGQAWRESGLTRPTTWHQRRADGSLLIGAVEPPLRVDAVGFAGFADRWASARPEQLAFAERDASGSGWRSLDWAAFKRQMHQVAAALLAMGLSQTRPLMILSANSLEQAVLVAAADYVGIPTAPVSPAYSLLSETFTRLRGIAELVEPAAVFVQDAAAFAKALQVLKLPPERVIAVRGATGGQLAWQSLLDALPSQTGFAAVREARAAIRPEHIARIFFTSGSTGFPKGVPISYDNVATMIGHFQFLLQAGTHEPPVVLDWLPWNHLFGGLGNVGRALTFGASYYIDDGRPLPGAFERTLRNLREVSPTMYANVPAAWAMLAQELERDDALARRFFARLKYAMYGGASLPRDAWERIQRAALRTVGERIVFTSGFGSTETSGLGSQFNRPGDDVGNVGVPNPGMEVKLLPLEGSGEAGDVRYEVRMRGRHIFPGYLKRPDLTAAAIDDEGFYRLGDAVRLADPADPAAGMRYAGRTVEDFKLASGTWVRTGSVRLALIEQCSPLLADAVICGHERDYVAALAWPNVAACQRLLPELATLPAAELVAHPQVVAAVAAKLRANGSRIASECVRRVLLMAEPPQPDANEIADKGYINQAAARERRGHLVEPLYAEPPGPAVATDR